MSCKSGFGMIYDSLDYAKKNEPKQTRKTWPVEEGKDVTKRVKGTQEQNEESQGGCKSQCWCWQKASWRLDTRRSKGAAVALSVVLVQIFHKRINELRMLM